MESLLTELEHLNPIRFHPLAGKCVWKGCHFEPKDNTYISFPSPCGEVCLESLRVRTAAQQLGQVSIPLRGSVFGKFALQKAVLGFAGRFHPLAGKCVWKEEDAQMLQSAGNRFHPLAGKCVWKEFAQETLQGLGFSRPIDTTFFVVN